MPLDNTFELPDITKEDELSDFIFVVQMLVEQYVRDVLGIYNDGDFLDKIRVFYRLYGNKKTMLYLSGRDDLPKVIMDEHTYYIDIKTSLENIRNLALFLLENIEKNEDNNKTPNV